MCSNMFVLYFGSSSVGGSGQVGSGRVDPDHGRSSPCVLFPLVLASDDNLNPFPPELVWYSQISRSDRRLSEQGHCLVSSVLSDVDVILLYARAFWCFSCSDARVTCHFPAQSPPFSLPGPG